MRVQQVSVDVWKMLVTAASYLGLAFAVWVLLRLVNACIMLPGHLKRQRHEEEEEEERRQLQLQEAIQEEDEEAAAEGESEDEDKDESSGKGRARRRGIQSEDSSVPSCSPVEPKAVASEDEKKRK